jgi:hypothetical protein
LFPYLLSNLRDGQSNGRSEFCDVGTSRWDPLVRNASTQPRDLNRNESSATTISHVILGNDSDLFVLALLARDRRKPQSRSQQRHCIYVCNSGITYSIDRLREFIFRNFCPSKLSETRLVEKRKVNSTIQREDSLRRRGAFSDIHSDSDDDDCDGEKLRSRDGRYSSSQSRFHVPNLTLALVFALGNDYLPSLGGISNALRTLWDWAYLLEGGV